MNLVIESGRLTKDPEIRTSPGGSTVARYTLAVDKKFKRDGEPTADFIPCVAFGKTAEFAERWFRKGIKIAITGHLASGSYEGKNGKVYTLDVVIDSQEFCEKKDATETPKEPKPEPATDDFMSIPDGADLPFA